jgi:hypothetical protein
MTTITVSPFQEALELIDRLPAGDQEALVEIVRKRLAEQRRRDATAAANAQATLQAFREGRASYGTIDDLRRELAE